MSDIFSHSDRIVLDQIMYHLETIARHMEKSEKPAPKWYEVDAGMLDLNRVVNLTKNESISTNSTKNSVFYLFFYFGGTDQGEITYSKKFETFEARDAEYERLKEKLMKK